MNTREEIKNEIEKTSADLWSLFQDTGADAIDVREHPEAYPQSNKTKEYRYGTYGDVVVKIFDDGATVTVYVPTMKTLVWKNRQKAFQYAKDARNYCNYMCGIKA